MHIYVYVQHGINDSLGYSCRSGITTPLQLPHRGALRTETLRDSLRHVTPVHYVLLLLLLLLLLG